MGKIKENGWLKSLNINVESQSKQRILAKKWTGEDINIESLSFQFPVKEGMENFY